MTGNFPTQTSCRTVPAKSVGDILLAHMAQWQVDLNPGITMAGKLPAGWTLVREDIASYPFGGGGGSIYTGIATKTAVAFDTVAQDGAYLFTNPSNNVQFGGTFLGVAIACVHNTNGIDHISYTHTNTPMTAAGATCTQANEIVLVLGTADTNAGATAISSATMPLAVDHGFSDSANQIWFQSGPAVAGSLSPSQILVSTEGPFPGCAGYQVSFLLGP